MTMWFGGVWSELDSLADCSLADCSLLTVQVELEIMLPEDMSVKESHDIALMLQHKVTIILPSPQLLLCWKHACILL